MTIRNKIWPQFYLISHIFSWAYCCRKKCQYHFLMWITCQLVWQKKSNVQEPPRRARSSHREGEGRGRTAPRFPASAPAPAPTTLARRAPGLAGCLASACPLFSRSRPACPRLSPTLQALLRERARPGPGASLSPAAAPLHSTPQAALEPRALQRPSGGEPGTPGLRRARLGLSKRHSAAFRSPVPTPKSGQADETSEDSLRLEIQELKQKRDTLDQEISQLMAEGYVVSELEDHISLLHEYNDIKDVGQMLMGKLASIRGVTTKELYPEFDLDMND